MRSKLRKRVNRVDPGVIPYAFGALALAICGFIAYNLVFMVNVVVMTNALYVACSIVVGGELENLLNVFIISFLTVIISDLCFAFLQPFIALGIFLFVFAGCNQVFLD